MTEGKVFRRISKNGAGQALISPAIPAIMSGWSSTTSTRIFLIDSMLDSTSVGNLPRDLWLIITPKISGRRGLERAI